MPSPARRRASLGPGGGCGNGRRVVCSRGTCRNDRWSGSLVIRRCASGGRFSFEANRVGFADDFGARVRPLSVPCHEWRSCRGGGPELRRGERGFRSSEEGDRFGIGTGRVGKSARESQPETPPMGHLWARGWTWRDAPGVDLASAGARFTRPIDTPGCSN